MTKINITLGLGNDVLIEHEPEPRNGSRIWSDYDAVAAVEGFDGEDHDEETLISAWQHLIDTGLAYSLQGWFGRQAEALIREGLCRRRADQ